MSARDVIATTLTAIETDTMPCKRCNGYGYHHGFGEHGHDPDWCEECHGPGFVMAHDATKTPDIIIAALTAAGYEIKAPGECEWSRDEDTDSFDASCGGKWCVVDGGTPEEEGHNFCGTCGKTIKFRSANQRDANNDR